MNAAHLHIVFTHLPIVGLGFVILLNLISLIYYKTNEFKKIIFWVYIIIGFFALFAYITGDKAEGIMKTYPGFTEEIIEPHENIALFLFIGLMITSLIAVLALYISKTKEILLRTFMIYLLIASVILSFLAIKTGFTGGKIRHTEIEKGVYNKEVKDFKVK